MKLFLREAIEDDFGFAFEVKRQAIGPHIVSHWGWDEAFQLAHHRLRWSEKPWFVMELDNKPVGTVSIDNGAEHTQFGEFYLLDGYRRRGLGAQLLREVLLDCDQRARAVKLEYLKWNPVGSLYKRHGFVVSGENDIHYFMLRAPRGL